MPPVVRVGVDLDSGHAGIDARPAMAGSPTVFCNGIAVVRLNDPWAFHLFGLLLPLHPGVGITGSSTVFCEGLAVMRQGDPISCGTTAMSGSLTVFCGG